MTAADRIRRIAEAAPTLGPDGAWLASALRRYLAHWSLSTPWRARLPHKRRGSFRAYLRQGGIQPRANASYRG